MAEQNKNQQNNDNINKDSNDLRKQDQQRADDILNPTGTSDPESDDTNREGGINQTPGQPSKGGRFGNASVEDGGTTDGSSAGSR